MLCVYWKNKEKDVQLHILFSHPPDPAGIGCAGGILYG